VVDLVVEDGTGIAGADVYQDLDDLTALLDKYGYTTFLQETDTPTLEAYARRASLYLDHAYIWKGARANTGQAKEFPRTGVYDRDGVLIPSTTIPAEIKLAEAFLVAAQDGGALVGPTGGSDDRVIQSESADDASVTYASGSSVRTYPTVSAILRYLTDGKAMGAFRQIPVQRG
jgi:hypothetical protein